MLTWLHMRQAVNQFVPERRDTRTSTQPLEATHRGTGVCELSALAAKLLPVEAEVAELADAQDLGSCGRKAVGVQLPPSAIPSLVGFSLTLAVWLVHVR
jgi:hypothetical protein